MKYKEDVHPGHASVEVLDEYLSVGADEEISSVGVATEHKIVYSDKFLEDVIGFLRKPDGVFDFYSLDAGLVREAIKQFKDSQVIYSLLGKRLFISEGESCATSSHVCLEAGGIENLLRIDDKIMSKRGILTPFGLASYAAKAKEKERLFFPEYADLGKDFAKHITEQAKTVIEKYVEATGQQQDKLEDKDSTKKRGPSI